MSYIPLPSNLGSGKVDTYQRLDGTDTVQVQVMAAGNPIAQVTGSLASATSVTASNLADAASVLVSVRGTYSATFALEASDDGTNWYAVTGVRTDSNTGETTSGALVNTARAWMVNIVGFTAFRLRCTAFTSGSASVTISPSTHSVMPDPYIPNIGVTSLPALPAGANSIGTVVLGAGAAAVGTVGVSSLPALPAGANSIGTVILGTGANSIGNVGTVTTVTSAGLAAGTNLAADVGFQYRASATGAATVASVLSPLTPAGASIKASAGRLIGWQLQNSSASIRSVKFYNATTVTMGTTAALFEVDIPAGGRTEINLPGGIAFTTGIMWAVTGAKGLTDNTTTGLAANDVSGSVFYA